MSIEQSDGATYRRNPTIEDIETARSLVLQGFDAKRAGNTALSAELDATLNTVLAPLPVWTLLSPEAPFIQK